MINCEVLVLSDEDEYLGTEAAVFNALDTMLAKMDSRAHECTGFAPPESHYDDELACFRELAS